ncbi:hypothetical protein Moror_9458 [Moniliophthora roreri MCA 2997]|uniref:Uncharacterized protein n=1 Tax=Moniliophthora roreri (strain MCA 2997) TaxID=1381753 RepID=V2Y2W6_MONRO|nr:hypothetical protein Moror_9458 [Moniliophthora roreri MCA 2997]
MSSHTNPSVQVGQPPFNPPTQVFPDDAVHTEPFHPSTFELLYLLNSEHYDEEMTTAIKNSSKRNCALYGCLLFLRGQRRQLLENMTRLDRHMGMLAQHISDDETFTVTGAIATQILTEIASLQTRIGLKRATEISKGQFLLQLRQRCVGAVQTPIPSSSIPQTHAIERVDASTSRRSPTPVAGVSSLPADQQTLLYPDPFPITDNTGSNESNVSNASGRAGKFPNVSPPATPPAMSPDHELPSTTSSATEPSRRTFQTARLSAELLNPLCLPAPIIPINLDTQCPYCVSVG